MIRALLVSLLLHVVLLLGVGVTILLPVQFEAPSAISVTMGAAGVAGRGASASGGSAPAETASRKPTPAASQPKVSEKMPVLTTNRPEVTESVRKEPVATVANVGSAGGAKEAVTEKSANETGEIGGLNARGRAGESHGAGSGGTPATGGASEGVRADDVRQYKIALATTARRFKRYPPLARERGWEGTVQLALDFRSNAPPEAVLLQSSGHALLDEQAVNMLTQAARAIPLPHGLRERNFRIELPVRFSLDESP